MEIIRGLYNIKPQQRYSVVTIGNFDGLHLGHIELLNQLRIKAQSLQKPTMVITFEPQPNEFFAKDNAPARLMRFREKAIGLNQQGVDKLLCLKFNEQLANLSPESFIGLLVDRVAPSYILVGDDFRFGHQRGGDIQLLKSLGKQYHFLAENLPTYKIANERVSSSRIRQALAAGNLSEVEQLLGKPFSLQGKVAKGDQRGRLLGFPTANLHLHRKKVPLNGVFAVQLLGLGNPVKGVANVGTRPTLSGEPKVLLEVHLFDFDQDIYGRHVEVQFLKKIRDEQKFPDLNSLQLQIANDVEQAKSLLNVG